MELEVLLIPSYRGNAAWYQRDGWFYKASRTRGPTVQLSCGSSRRCPAKFNYRHGQGLGPVEGEHDHDPTPWILERNAMFQALRVRAMNEELQPIDIYNQEAVRFPNGSIHLPFREVESSIRRWRNSVRPRVPASLEAYAAALAAHPDYGMLLIGTVSVGDAWAVILGMPDFGRCLRDCTVMMADATFRSVPAGLPAHQIFTLHGVYEGHFFHPVIALMSNRRRALYEAVIRRVWQAAGQPQPQYIVADYEEAIHRAFETVTGIPTHGCFFHYAQALLRYARRIGLTVYNRNSRDMPLLRLYIALALLPADRVPLGLAEIRGLAEANDLRWSERFHEYFVAQWIVRVGAERFSVQGRYHRTTNTCESFHSLMRNEVGYRPNVWTFTARMKSRFSICWARYHRQRLNGDLARRNTTQNYLRARELMEHERSLERGGITVREFISILARVLVERLELDDDVPEVGQEVEVEFQNEDDAVVLPIPPAAARPAGLPAVAGPVDDLPAVALPADDLAAAARPADAPPAAARPADAPPAAARPADAPPAGAIPAAARPADHLPDVAFPDDDLPAIAFPAVVRPAALFPANGLPAPAHPIGDLPAAFGPALETAPRRFTCNVCLDEYLLQNMVAIVPCGHTVCDNCQGQLQFCPSCRGGIISFLRVFFSFNRD